MLHTILIPQERFKLVFPGRISKVINVSKKVPLFFAQSKSELVRTGFITLRCAFGSGERGERRGKRGKLRECGAIKTAVAT